MSISVLILIIYCLYVIFDITKGLKTKILTNKIPYDTAPYHFKLFIFMQIWLLLMLFYLCFFLNHKNIHFFMNIFLISFSIFRIIQATISIFTEKVVGFSKLIIKKNNPIRFWLYIVNDCALSLLCLIAMFILTQPSILPL